MNMMTVPFHGDSLYVVNHNREPYVPMKPIVEGMGLDWKTQYRKLKQRFNSCMVEMTIQLPVIPNVALLSAWLYVNLLAGCKPSTQIKLNLKSATESFSIRKSAMMFSMNTGRRVLSLILVK